MVKFSMSIGIGICLLLVCVIQSLNAATTGTPAASTGSTNTSPSKAATTAGPTTAPSTKSPSGSSAKPSPAPFTKTSLSPLSTTLNPDEECSERNSSCEYCLKKTECMFCKTDSTCIPYPVGSVIPPSHLCALDEARWAVCWLNFEAMIISVSVIGGIIIIGVTTFCVCCCCCRGGNKKRAAKDDARYEEQKMERKAQQADRRHERKGRLDEIRRKYGLMKDDDP